jgi:hypothetical protein
MWKLRIHTRHALVDHEHKYKAIRCNNKQID